MAERAAALLVLPAGDAHQADPITQVVLQGPGDAAAQIGPRRLASSAAGRRAGCSPRLRLPNSLSLDGVVAMSSRKGRSCWPGSKTSSTRCSLSCLASSWQRRACSLLGAAAVMARRGAPDTRRLHASSYLYVRACKYSYGGREAVGAALAHPFRGQGAAFAKTLNRSMAQLEEKHIRRPSLVAESSWANQGTGSGLLLLEEAGSAELWPDGAGDGGRVVVAAGGPAADPAVMALLPGAALHRAASAFLRLRRPASLGPPGLT